MILLFVQEIEIIEVNNTYDLTFKQLDMVVVFIIQLMAKIEELKVFKKTDF